jgi:hypothetical protein
MPNPFLPSVSGKRYSVGFQTPERTTGHCRTGGAMLGIWSYVDNDLASFYDQMEELWFDFCYFNGYLWKPQNSFRCEEFEALADGVFRFPVTK